MPPPRTTVRRLHRWLGITALVFVCLLSITGIALNHSDDLRLGERYLAAPWLLAWYGIEAPAPTAAFATDAGHVVLLGDRLFLGDRELAAGLTAAVGAVVWRNDLVVAEADGLLFFSGGALDRRAAPPGSAPIDRFGSTVPAEPSAEPLLVVESRRAWFRYDGNQWLEHPLEPGRVLWSTPAAIDEATRARAARAYRGPGVSVERVLADLHSGRLFAKAGKLATDAIGAALLLLGVTGFVLWLRGRR